MPIILGSFWVPTILGVIFGVILGAHYFGVIFRCGVLSGHLVGEGLKLVGSLVGSLVGKPVGGGAEQVWWCGQVGLGI